jgi:hypothetical protein
VLGSPRLGWIDFVTQMVTHSAYLYSMSSSATTREAIRAEANDHLASASARSSSD